jgi:hypothetical protein
MSTTGTPARLLALLVLVAFFVPAFYDSTAQAQSGSPVVRVEEDWELVVGQPDSSLDAPQVTAVFSPVGHLNSVHAAFELNHQSQPSFVAGGLQLQIWNGEAPLSSRKFPNPAKMQTSAETVRWTQRMLLWDDVLVFEVSSGSSSTWGSFGGQGYLVAGVSTSLNSLNSYNPQVSVENSGVGYASNRVTSLVLKRVRYRTADGQEFEDNTERVVYSKE